MENGTGYHGLVSLLTKVGVFISFGIMIGKKIKKRYAHVPNY